MKTCTYPEVGKFLRAYLVGEVLTKKDRIRFEAHMCSSANSAGENSESLSASKREKTRNDAVVANAKHVELLATSVRAFNRYREEHPDEVIDLSGAVLPRVDSEGVSIQEANLKGANIKNNRVLKKP